MTATTNGVADRYDFWVGNKALVSNTNKEIAESVVTDTELGYLDGVTSNVQTQLNNSVLKVPAGFQVISTYALGCGGGYRATGYDTSGFSGTGPGIEVHYDSANTRARVLAYDRTASARIPLAIDGSPITFYANAVAKGSFDASGNFNLVNLTASRALVSDASKNVVSSAVTSTELGYVSGVTSAIQTQLNAKQANVYKTVFEASWGSSTTTAGWCKLGTYTGNNMSRFEIRIIGKAGWNDQNYSAEAIIHGGTNYIGTDSGQIAAGCKWDELPGSGPTASAIRLVRQSGYASGKFDVYILNDTNYVNWLVEFTAVGGSWSTGIAWQQTDPGTGTNVFDAVKASVLTSVDNATSIANWNTAYGWGNHASAGYMVASSYPDLTAIEALSGTSGLLKKTGTNTWTLDTTSYQTALGYTPINKAGDSGIAALTFSDNIYFANPTNGTYRGIQGTVGANDFWRVMGRADSDNAGYLEIATADDGTEPIYVRQYSSGVFGTLARSASLLDASGNTSFPGSITAGNGVTTNGWLVTPYGTIRTITSDSTYGAIYADGITAGSANYALTWKRDGTGTSLNGTTSSRLNVNDSSVVIATAGQAAVSGNITATGYVYSSFYSGTNANYIGNWNASGYWGFAGNGDTNQIIRAVVCTSAGVISGYSSLAVDKLYTNNNGSGTNIQVGDDCWIGDINIGNTMSVRGVQNSGVGYIRFGSDSNGFGYNGSRLDYGGTLGAYTLTGNSLSVNYIDCFQFSANGSRVAISVLEATATKIAQLEYNVQDITTSTTLGSYALYLVNSASDLTLTLPSPTAGRSIKVVVRSCGSNGHRMYPASGHTIAFSGMYGTSYNTFIANPSGVSSGVACLLKPGVYEFVGMSSTEWGLSSGPKTYT